MEISKKFVVFRFNDDKTLEAVEFRGWRANSFDTEEEAIRALIDDDKNWNYYIILKQVYIP